MREDRGRGDTLTPRPGSVPGRSARRLSHALRCVAVLLAVHPHTLATTTRSTHHARQPLVTSMAVAATATPPTAVLLSQWTGRHRAQGRRPVSRVRWAEAPGWPLARPDTALTLADRSVAGGSRLDIDSGERVAREPAAAASMIRWLRYHGFGIDVHRGGPHVRHRVRVTLRQLLPRDRRGEELACEGGSCWRAACSPRSW